jgi:hypothetical protein
MPPSITYRMELLRVRDVVNVEADGKETKREEK